MNVLLTVLSAFPVVLIRVICLKIKIIFFVLVTLNVLLRDDIVRRN